MSVQYTYCSLGLFTLHAPATFITLKTQLHVLSNDFLTICLNLFSLLCKCTIKNYINASITKFFDVLKLHADGSNVNFQFTL